MRTSVRVTNRCRWTYSTLSSELKASAAALSKHEPTRPIDWTTPSLAHRFWQAADVYSPGSTSGRNTDLLDR